MEHARDVSRPGDRARKFRRCENLRFAGNTCFILTEAGQQVLEAEASGPTLRFPTGPARFVVYP